MSLPKLLLLHGAIGAKDQLEPLKKLLSPIYEVFSMSFVGHGEREATNESFSMKLFANDVLAFMHQNNIDHTNIFGYSMGGYVALYLAKYHPEKVNKIVTLGTKFNWNEQIAEKEVELLDAEKIEAKVPKFAAVLKERHSRSGWKNVLKKTVELLYDLGKDNTLKLNDFSEIKHEVKILLADADVMVSEKESEAVADELENGSFEYISNSQHPIEKVDLNELNKHLQCLISLPQ